jgi:hypothetical protein
MTLERAVVNLRKDFWEHGQLYVARSRIADPRNLCILLPPSPVKETDEGKIDQPSSEEKEEQEVGIRIRVTVDEEMMAIISQMQPNERNDNGDEAEDIGVIEKQ